MKTKRILWILNHKTLMKFEVPLLRKLGYEVYMPKKPPFDISVDVDWESDKLLSIPQKELDILNEFDFYEDIMTPEVARVMNQYFDIAMFIHTPCTIESMVDWFKGVLVLRAYGRMQCEGSYTDVIIQSLGLGYYKKIETLGSRFVFGESYKGISKKECDFFRNHTMYMPIGLPSCEINDRWDDTEKKVLFICPRIKDGGGLFESKYKTFKNNFKNIPHDIGGAQPIEVLNDPSVLGYLPQEKYDKLYPSHSCLFYDSTEPNHITYPPLEAVRCGLPVLFMAGGMLDSLGGKNLPGRCTSIAEARKKAKRLIAGDEALAKKIRSSQPVLLEKFSMKYCLPFWKEAMSKIETHVGEVSCAFYGRNKKRLCVVLPEGYTGGVLDYTLRVLKALKMGIDASSDPVELFFAHSQSDVFKEKDYFKPVRDMNIPIRTYSLKPVTGVFAAEMLQLMGIKYSLSMERTYYLPFDGINYFSDCDALLYTVDRLPETMLHFQPYGLVSHDYIQRLAPQIFPANYNDCSFLELARNAKAIFTSTPTTKEHTIQYAGAEERRTHLIPVPFEMKEMSACSTVSENKDNYFLWSTNTAAHKNHKVVLEALIAYYTSGGKNKCVVTGVNTQLLSPKIKDDDPRVVGNEYLRSLRETIAGTKVLRSNMVFMGNLPKQQYILTLKNARFLLHPGRFDNGNGTAFDAAYLGVPTASSDYGPMRFYDKYFSLNMKFFDCRDPEEICSTLHYMEKNSDEAKKHLPSKEQMEKLMVSNPAIYNTIYGLVKQYLLAI